MFTGLIEETAKLIDIKTDTNGAKIYFEINNPDFKNVKIGDSIALNGACLTITSISGEIFCADMMNETLNLTNLKFLKKDDLINLERALAANARFDGHIVQGHVDTTAEIVEIKQDGFSKKIKLKCDNELVVKKGSIALNGISLTVSDVFDSGFEVSLIPETIKKTNLKNIQIGAILNIEYDILGKYIKKFISNSKNSENSPHSKITTDFLKQNGF